MKNCDYCGISVMKEPLQRVNEFGKEGIWWCEPCIEKEEPELYRNIKEDEDDFDRDIKEIFYGKR